MTIARLVLLLAAAATGLAPFAAAPAFADGAPAVSGVAVRAEAGADAAPGRAGGRVSTDSGTPSDTTPPRLVRGEVDGGTMRLFFSEALDPDSTGGRFMVDLSTARLTSNFDAAGPVSVDGNVVTVGLGAGNPRAEAGRLDHNRVLYIRRADGAGGALRDLAGNLVTAPDVLPVGDGVEWRYVRMALANVTAPAPDSTPPRLLRGEIDGGTVTLFFSEALDPDAAGGAFHVQVQTSANDVTSFFATGAVAIDGAVVKVGVGAGRPRARAGLTEMNYAYYLAPLDPASGGLRGLSGNPVETPSAHPGGRGRTRILSLDNVTVATPAVTGVAVTSVAGGDATYALGETVRVRLTFSEAVNVTGTPRLKLGLGAGAERWADYASGSGTAALTFAWTVARDDASGAGVAVLANTLALNGGTIQSASSQVDAARAHGGLAHDAAHKVDGTPDTTPPRLSRSEVNGATLTLAFDEAIDGAASPASGAFTVKRTPAGGAGETVGLSGAPAIAGAAVTLTLAEAVRDTDTNVRVSYRKSRSDAGNRLRDAAGNEVAGFSNEPVTNNTPDTTPPRLERGEIDGATVTLYFSEPLEPGSKGGRFWMSLQAPTYGWSHYSDARDVQISGNVVKVGLPWRLTGGLSGNTLMYRPPADPTKGLRDLAGNPLRAPVVTCWGSCYSTTRWVGLDNVTGVALTVTGVVVSSDAGGDATYGLDDTIRVRLTFSKAVAVTGAPRVKIDFSSGAGDEKWADYARSVGMRTLEFTYTVAERDASSAGVAVLANTLALNGGTIRSTAGADAALSHAGLGHDPAHKVDWQRSPAPTVTGVAISSEAGTDHAYARGETIKVRLTFSEAVAVTGTPRVKLDFGYETEGGKWADYADGDGTTMLEFAYTVARGDTAGTGVAVLANTLALNGGAIRSTTTQTDADRVHAGVDHDSTHTVDGITPTLLQAAVEGVTLTLVFDEALGAAESLASGAFTVNKTPRGDSEQEVSLTGSPAISGARVTLTLANAVLGTDTDVKVSYTRPTMGTGNRLRDAAGNEAAGFIDQPVRKGAPDITPPRLVRGEIDDAMMTLFFSEPLDPDSTGGGFRVNMRHINGQWYIAGATRNMTVSGNVVSVGLGHSSSKWQLRAKAGEQRNSAYYLRRSDPDAKQLRDLAGNPVQALQRLFDGEWKKTRSIDLDNVTGVALTVTGVAVSSEAGAGATYSLGDTIRVRLTFSKAVNVTGTPRVRIDLSSAAGDEKWADYADGSGKKTLEFAYTVAEGDTSSAGVAVLANTLELGGGSIRSVSTAGENAALAHAGLDHDPNHRVDTPPIVSAARVNGVTLKVTFNEPLVAAAPLVNSAFAVKKTPQGSSEQNVRLRSPAIEGATVTLTLANAALETDTGVKVSYSRLTTGADNRLRDEAGNEVASFSVEDVTNGSRPPRVERAEVRGTALTLTFDETLGAAASLANDAFTVKKTPQGGVEEMVSLSGSPAIEGATVTLTLANAVLETDTGVKVSYTRPDSGTGNRLRDEAGNEVASFRGQAVGPDETAPTLDRGEIDGGTVILYFSEALDEDSVGGHFRVQVQLLGKSAWGFSATGDVEISGRKVTVGLGEGKPRAREGGTNIFRYIRPTDRAKGLRDLAGNAVENTTHIILDNLTGPPSVTGVAISSDAGADATYGLGETIRVTLTFSKAVTVTGVPRLQVDFSSATGDEQWAAYADGSGTRMLEFAWTVAEPNVSTQGVAVLANTLALNGGTIESASTAGENAALAHEGLGYDTAHKVDWRPTLSVADARANEGAGAAVAFEVSLSRAAAGAVTVDYATADGTAEAGADYTAASGTLTFAAGETMKTVSVALLDDALDEGEETFSLTLSNAQGARITDGEATGTIANADPLQKMWLSRFGRTVAGHVTDAVSDRLANPLTGAQVTVGGQRVDLARTGDEGWLGEVLAAVARALGAREEFASEDGPGSGPGPGLGVRESAIHSSAAARGVSGRELLLGSGFHLAAAAAGEGDGPGLAAWGRATVGGFDGEAPADGGDVRLDGLVTTAILGADVEWNRLLAGVAVSVSEGEGTFDQPGVDSGTIESTMTAVSPYARVMLNDRVSAWGLLGYGAGDMTIVQAATDRGQPERVTRTGLGMRLAAGGGRGALLKAGETGGIDLGLRADAFWVETESEAVSNEGATTAEASRVRLILEGSRALAMGGGALLTPGVELGLRHDGGDAETGSGAELGGRLAWSDPGMGLGVETRVRALVAHEDANYGEWGASGSIRLAPGARGRGLSFSLAPTWGAASSGMDRLWSARDARGLAPGAGFEPERRLQGELGYGFALFGDRFTGTPNVGFEHSDRAREYRIGWRLTSAAQGHSGFEVSLDATRRERAGPGAGPEAEHAVTLRGAIRW